MPVGPTAGPIGGPPDAFGAIIELINNAPTSHEGFNGYFSFFTYTYSPYSFFI